MDGRQIRLGVNATLGERRDHPIPIRTRRQLHHVDEPAPPRKALIGGKEKQSLRIPLPGRGGAERLQRLCVELRDPCPLGNERIRALDLCDPERGLEIRDPVVEAQPLVGEPAHLGAPLIPLAPHERSDIPIRRDRHAALAGHELLVWIEAEDRDVAARADLDALGVHCARGLRRVLEDSQPAIGGKPLQFRHGSRAAEDVHRQEPGSPLGHGRRSGARVHVQRHRVDVAKDGYGVLVQQAVGGGDEAERARDHLVARAPAKRANAQMKRRRSRRDGNSVIGPDPSREVALEPLEHRAERQPPRPQRLEHQLLLARTEVRAREGDDPLAAHDRVWWFGGAMAYLISQTLRERAINGLR